MRPISRSWAAEGRWATYVIENGRAGLRPMEVGHQNGFAAEALDGVEPGDRVIVHPSDRVHDGSTIQERD